MSKSKLAASTIFISSFLLVAATLLLLMYTTKTIELEGGSYSFLVSKDGWKVERIRVDSEDWFITFDSKMYRCGDSQFLIEVYGQNGDGNPLLVLEASFHEASKPSLERVSGVGEKTPRIQNLWRLFQKDNQYYPDLPSGEYVIKIYWKNVKWHLTIEEIHCKLA
ncbi:hypothetical protein CW709_00575 [Candidatus Bathyarchaeota archaeon]|nr:MAG: hypothetical protein CW709_00575 [Candidatus Bathyarchaeota archaeon]RLG98284.1 MAG: hypothetical protein DRO28_02915 [Candidatus Bathyarchaeota archaeon]